MAPGNNAPKVCYAGLTFVRFLSRGESPQKKSWVVALQIMPQKYVRLIQTGFDTSAG
uniref:ATP synthase subunit beta n=1 Tax=Citrus limon TaxID=2708 RepID=A0A1S8ABN5_CITLI